MSKHTPMVVAAAKALCRRGAEQCCVDFDDSWKVYGDEYLTDAQATLEAAGVPALLAALQSAADSLAQMALDRNDQELADLALNLRAAARGATE